MIGTDGAEHTFIEWSEEGDGVMAVLSSAVTLSGLTVRGGSATRGGGIRYSVSEGSLEDCAVTSNSAQQGCGLYLWYSDISVSDTSVSQNLGAQGGGLMLVDSSALLEGCAILDNDAESEESPEQSGSNYWSSYYYRYGEGGGLYASGSSQVSLAHCSLRGNRSNGYGAGIYLEEGGALLENCELFDNLVVATWYENSDYGDTEAASYGGRGGGVYLKEANLEASYCVLAGNGSEFEGGGMYWDTLGPYPVAFDCRLQRGVQPLRGIRLLQYYLLRRLYAAGLGQPQPLRAWGRQPDGGARVPGRSGVG